MLDHIGLDVSDYEVSKEFYERALAPLGIGLLMEFEGFGGFGEQHDRKPYFWIGTRGPAQTAIHLAFAAPDRGQVDAFHAVALAAGGVDNGAPGLRAYHPNYYGAFVLDPDGNNVEAVCHRPT